MSARNGLGGWKSHKFIVSSNHIRDIIVQNRAEDKQKISKTMRSHSGDNLKFHALKSKTLYRSYHLLVFHGTDLIRLMKLSKSGNFKKAKSTLLRSPGPMI